MYSLQNPQDVRRLSDLLEILCDADGGTRNTAAVLGHFVNGENVHISWSAGLFPAVIVADAGAQLAVFVGGANNTLQGLSLLTAALAPASNVAVAQVNGAALRAAIALELLVSSIRPTLPASVVLVGHSYGGAAVELLAGRWITERQPAQIQLMTLGAPRAGDSRLSAILDGIIHLRFMNPADPIPAFPPHFDEAPFAVFALGFVGATELNNWTQTGGGLVLHEDGNVTQAELPPQIAPIQDVILVSWATGPRGFLSSEHWYRTYARRLRNYALVQPPVPNFNRGGSLKGELVQPLVQADFNLGPVLGPVAQDRRDAMAFSSVYIPVPHQWRPVKVGTSWWASWESELVVQCQTHSQAKSICKAGNKQLRVLQNALAISRGAWTTAVGIYLNAASAPAGGFMPVVTVTA
jgi:hypothetical protein